MFHFGWIWLGIPFIRRSCLGWLLALGLYCAFNQRGSCANASTQYLRLSSAIGRLWLHKLVHIVVLMSMVQMIELDLEKMSQF